MKNKFLEKVSEQIADEKSRQLITAELESHLLDKIDYYTDIGYSKEEAEKRATEEMGNPDDTAVPLNSLHTNTYRGIFTILLFAAIFILFIITVNTSPNFCYVAYYLNITHYAMYDLCSLAIIAAYALVIIYCQKSNCKSVAIFIIISLGFQILMSAVSITFQVSFMPIINFSSIFQPAIYAIITIFTKGPIVYIDSLFAYEQIDYTVINDWCYIGIAFIIMALLLLWAIAVLIKIRGNERMNGKKIHLKITKGFKNIFLVFLSVNFLITGICSVISRVEVNFKSNEIIAKKEKVIDFVLNSSLKNTADKFWNNANENGIDFQQNFKYGRYPTLDPSNEEYVYRHNGNMISATIIDNCISLKYKTLDNSIFCNNSHLTDKEVDSINNLVIGDSIDKLYKSGIIYKVKEINRDYHSTDEDDINSQNVKHTLKADLIFAINECQTVDINISHGKIIFISDPTEYKKEYETGFNFFIRS